MQFSFLRCNNYFHNASPNSWESGAGRISQLSSHIKIYGKEKEGKESKGKKAPISFFENSPASAGLFLFRPHPFV
jgi:hypothetical protein